MTADGKIDLVDEAFIVAPPGRVAAVIRDPTRWHRWWPGLTLTVFMDRGDAGLRWTVTGALRGSLEVWLEPWADGTVLHLYLRAAVPPGRSVTRTRRRFVRAWKRDVWALKDALELGQSSTGSAMPSPTP